MLDVEALARLNADPLHLRNNRFVSEVRRLQFEKLGRIGEVIAALHGIDLNFRRRFHVDARIDLHLDRLGRLAPLRQRRDLVTGLDFVNRIVVRRPISLGAANDPDIGRRRFDLRKSRRYGPVPAPRRDEEIARLRSRRAPTRRGKYVRPHVEHGQKIITPARVRDGDDHRLFGEVEIANGVQRVEIGPHHLPHVGGRKRRKAEQRIHRRADPFAGLDIRELLAGHVHCHKRVEIDVGVPGNGLRLLFGDGALCLCGE